MKDLKIAIISCQKRFCNSKLMQQKIMIMEPNKFDQSIKEKKWRQEPSCLRLRLGRIRNNDASCRKPKRKVAWLYIKQVLLDCLLWVPFSFKILKPI
jgi:hypothetical protein